MATHGFYSGSFDPVTNGHLDIINRALKICDRLSIGIGVHPEKKYMFSQEERIYMVEKTCMALDKAAQKEINIFCYETLTVKAVQDCGASFIIRGLRDSSDFDYEMQMSGMNGQMEPELETVFLAASPEVRHIAANLVRQIASMQGNTRSFVPAVVDEMLKDKYC